MLNSIAQGGYVLEGLAGINVVLGKNGCGKSTMFKRLEERLVQTGHYGLVRYISPERAGFLNYEAGVEQAMTQQGTWLADTRRSNQTSNFKQQSATLFRRLQMMFWSQMEADQFESGYQPRTFQVVIDKINTLLERVYLERQTQGGFLIKDRDTQAQADASQISSGESELISLAIEFLAFAAEADRTKENVLLIDEPDVHLHPDLQDRLARFLSDELAQEHITVLLATHSTPLLSALSVSGGTVAFMRRGDTNLAFQLVTDVLERVLPMFGAHPLSNVFNASPILIVEGEDDERIWQQAVRSSGGRLRLFPCVAETVDKIGLFEAQADKILQAVYDQAVGYSLRDRDENPEEIDDFGRIQRMRLSCRAAENLMLTDDALQMAGWDWPKLQARVAQFVQESPHHPYHGEVQDFAAGFDRKSANLKQIRNVLVGFISNKPWEVLVGQTIGRLMQGQSSEGEHALRAYLGEKVCRELLRLPTVAEATEPA